MDKVIRNTTFPRSFDPAELDFFSGGVGIRVRGSDRVKNYFAIFLTLLAYGMLGGAGWWYVTDFFDDKNPKVVFHQKIQNQANKFQMGEIGTKFFFLVGNPQASITSTDFTSNQQDGSISSAADSTGNPFSTNPSNVVGINSPYLSFDQVGQYFNAQVIREIVTFNSDATSGSDTVSTGFVAYALTSCAAASWFKDPNLLANLKKNPYLYAVLEKYGICLDLPANAEIFGDEMSKSYSKIKFSLTNCNSVTSTLCLLNAAGLIATASRLKVEFGAFEPVLEEESKKAAWTYSLNLKSKIDVSVMNQMNVDVSLKAVEVETDNGWVWPAKQSDTKGIIDQIMRSMTASFAVSPDITSNLSPVPATSPNFVLRPLATQANYVSVNIGSSRVYEKVQKVYPNVQDVAGKIGGSVELGLIVLLLLFHWTENLFKGGAVRQAAKVGLKIPDSLSNSKYSKNTADVFDDLSEEAIALENMVLVNGCQKFIMESTMSPEAKKLLPIAVFMKKSIDKRSKPVTPQAAAAPLPQAQADPKLKNTTEGTKIINVPPSVTPPEDPKLNYTEAFDRLSKSQVYLNRPTSLLEQQIVETINTYCSTFGVSNVQEILKSEQAGKTGPSQVQPATQVAGNNPSAQGTNLNSQELAAKGDPLNQTGISEMAPINSPQPFKPNPPPQSFGAKPPPTNTPTIVVSPVPKQPEPARSPILNNPAQQQTNPDLSKHVTFADTRPQNQPQTPTYPNPSNTAQQPAPFQNRSPPQAESSNYRPPQQPNNPTLQPIYRGQENSRFSEEGRYPAGESRPRGETAWSSENRGNFNSTAPSGGMGEGENTRAPPNNMSWRNNSYNQGGPEQQQQSGQNSPQGKPRVFRTRAFYEAEARRGPNNY